MQYLAKLSDRAVRDLAGIYDFIQADSSAAAYARFLDLEKAGGSLEQHPERGKPDPSRIRFHRLLFGNKPSIYKIVHEIDRRHSVVKVFHIRHGARA